MVAKSEKPTTAKKVLTIVAWSAMVALLFGVGGFIFPAGEASVSSRIVRFATTGLLFGAVTGAINAKVIRGWRGGAAVGALCGAVSGTVWWIATVALGIENSQGALLLLGTSLLANVLSGAVAGLLFALLMAERR